MDCFTLAQHDRIRQWFALPDWRRHLRPSPNYTISQSAPPQLGSNSNRRSAIRGFWTLAVLNVPIFTGFQVLKMRKELQTSRTWTRWSETTLFGRYLSYPLEYVGFKRWFLRVHSNSSANIGEIRKWNTLLGFQPADLASGRYWTFLTSSFTHLDWTHFVTNMAFFCQIAPLCAEVPGLTSLHVFAVTLISSLAGSLALTAQLTYYPPTRNPWIASQLGSVGFSGVNMAFLAVAVLSSPGIPVTGISAPFPVPCWAVCGFILMSDAYGLLHIMDLVPRSPLTPKMANVGHAAHLAGFLSGALYYLLFLKPSRSMPMSRVTNKGEVLSGGLESSYEGYVLEEQGESNLIPAPRRTRTGSLP